MRNVVTKWAPILALLLPVAFGPSHFVAHAQAARGVTDWGSAAVLTGDHGVMSRFLGSWVNSDQYSATRIARVIITPEDASSVRIHLYGYGRCAPALCDWGEQVGHISLAGDNATPSIAVEFSVADELKYVVISSEPNGTLHCHVEADYINKSGKHHRFATEVVVTPVYGPRAGTSAASAPQSVPAASGQSHAPPQQAYAPSPEQVPAAQPYGQSAQPGAEAAPGYDQTYAPPPQKAYGPPPEREHKPWYDPTGWFDSDDTSPPPPSEDQQPTAAPSAPYAMGAPPGQYMVPPPSQMTSLPPTRFSPNRAGDADSAYTLGPGDQLRINVFGQTDITGDYQIDGTGHIQLPLIGQVVAAGRTVLQLQGDIVGMLSPRYLVDPSVSIQVVNYRPFYIIGEVNKPGQYPYVSGMSVLTAVALAGGFTYRADDSEAYIKRQDRTGEIKVPANDNTKVLPGDIVRIPERMF